MQNKVLLFLLLLSEVPVTCADIVIIIVYNRRVLQCFVTDEVDWIVVSEDKLNWEIKGIGRDSLPKETRPLDRNPHEILNPSGSPNENIEAKYFKC